MIRVKLALFLSLATAAFCADRHVVIVSIDGFSASALRDPALPVPTLRRLMREGAFAERLMNVNPTVTWPNHTSMVTGVTPARHGVLFNGLVVRDGDRVKVEPWRPKEEMVRARTVYDLAHAAGIGTAEVDWVAIYRARTVNWSFPEVPDPNGTIEKEMIAAGRISREDVAGFTKRPITWRDEVWTQAAIHILEHHRPGLLLFHLLATDSVQHQYGPGNLAMSAALALADARLGELLGSIEGSDLRDNTTLIVTSDHGFKVVKRHIGARMSGAVVIPEGGTAMVYLPRGGKPAVSEAAAHTFAALEGVDRVLTPSDFAGLGLPLPQNDPSMADLVLAAKDGYAFAGGQGAAAVTELAAPQGSHGYLNSDPEMNAIFVAWGAGIRPAKLAEARTVDIAPTVARLLGLEMPGVDGRVLTEILK